MCSKRLFAFILDVLSAGSFIEHCVLVPTMYHNRVRQAVDEAARKAAACWRRGQFLLPCSRAALFMSCI